MKKTYMHRQEDVKRHWHLIDAQGQILGRLASQVAQILIGKHKPEYTPHVDGGDYVVIINAAQVEVSGNKGQNKLYFRHTGYPGGIKDQTLTELLHDHPERVIQKAVYNMLPKNKLRSGRVNRLKIYAGAEHPHQTHFKSSQEQK